MLMFCVERRTSAFVYRPHENIGGKVPCKCLLRRGGGAGSVEEWSRSSIEVRFCRTARGGGGSNEAGFPFRCLLQMGAAGHVKNSEAGVSFKVPCLHWGGRGLRYNSDAAVRFKRLFAERRVSRCRVKIVKREFRVSALFGRGGERSSLFVEGEEGRKTGAARSFFIECDESAFSFEGLFCCGRVEHSLQLSRVSTFYPTRFCDDAKNTNGHVADMWFTVPRFVVWIKRISNNSNKYTESMIVLRLGHAG